MATFGPIMTCNGYDPATGLCASKTIPSSIPPSQYDAYMSGQYDPYGATATVDMAPAGETGIAAIMRSIGTIDKNIPFLGALDSKLGINPGDPGSVTNPDNGPVASAAAGVSSLLGIATDLPRLGTIVVGGLFIAAGLFALASGNKIIQAIKP